MQRGCSAMSELCRGGTKVTEETEQTVQLNQEGEDLEPNPAALMVLYDIYADALLEECAKKWAEDIKTLRQAGLA
jgi:hypothetical protein